MAHKKKSITKETKVKQNSLSCFDMNAALDQYPPPKENGSPGPFKSQLPKSPSKDKQADNLELNKLLHCYPPGEADLKQKSVSNFENGHKGKESYQRKKKLEQLPTSQQIDLHGRSQEEAQQCLQDFLSRSQTNGVQKVKIIHGKGHHSPNGESVLQELVWEILREAKCAGWVLEYLHPREKEGGKGVTIALLASGNLPKELIFS